MKHETADSALADALWWFRGFKAAQPAEGSDATFDIQSKLLDVRNWLKRMSEGRHRLLGLEDRTLAVVMTEAEFERIVDGLHTHSTEADRALARETYTRILRQFRDEQKHGDLDLPF